MNPSSAVIGDWTMMATGARHCSLLLPLTTHPASASRDRLTFSADMSRALAGADVST